MMKTYIALFRGINVGGNNKLPMKELVPYLHQAGFKNIQTYLQTGNVVLLADKEPAEQLSDITQQYFGFQPAVITLDKNQFASAMHNNPFKVDDGKSTHFYFCSTKPEINEEKIANLKTEREQLQVIDNVCYLNAPDGIGRSKLASNLEKCLGVSATGRNLNTVKKIWQMLNQA